MFHLQLSDDPAVEPDKPSPKDTFSMPFIKRHIRRRLTNAKDTCDKELKRVIASITEHVESRLRESAQDTPPLLPDSPDLFSTRSHSHTHSVSTDANETAVAEDNELEYHLGHHSRRVSISASASSSPSSLRRHPTLPRSSQVDLSPGKNKQTTPASSSASYAQSGVSRRLSRNMHIPIMPTHPDSQSRSSSRSRSPLPPSNLELSTSPRSTSGIAARRLSRFEFEQFPPDQFMATLHDVISIATDIIDTPITNLIAEPNTCAEFVKKVQKVGRAWDEHPDWQGRGWYVQLLLAVAGLSRVVEWWEAEKQFWNLEEDNDDEIEPLTFVVKPHGGLPKEDRPPSAETMVLNETDPSGSTDTLDPGCSHLVGRDRPSRTPSTDAIKAALDVMPAPGVARPPFNMTPSGSGKPSRSGSMEKVTTVTSPAPIQSPERPPVTGVSEDALMSPNKFRQKATDNLRVQAEKAQSSNIVLELNVESEQIMWANEAWDDVVGSSVEIVAGTSISNLLAPEDKTVFKEAIQLLREDASHTVEVRFRMIVQSPETPMTPDEANDGESGTSTESASSAHAPMPEPPTPAPPPEPVRPQPTKRPTLRKALSSILRPSSSTPAVQSSPLPTPAVTASVSLPLIDTSAPLPQPPRLYRDFEGKGMLMLDRVTGNPSHTMWVIKPMSEPETLEVLRRRGTDESGDQSNELATPASGFNLLVPGTPMPPISTQIILCRICEVGIPEWFFETHNETCMEVHKLEAAIGECNESIQELRSTVKDLSLTLDKDRDRLSPGLALVPNSLPASPMTPPPEYRGMPIFTSSAPSSPAFGIGRQLASPLQLFRPHLGSKKKKKPLDVKLVHKALLEALDDILLVTLEISTPGLKDDQQGGNPQDRLRLMSPDSERKVQVAAEWKRPQSLLPDGDDPALSRLVEDVEMLIRTKLDNVNRLANTVFYSERVRQEWEERFQAATAHMSIDMIIDEIEEEIEETPASVAMESEGQASQRSLPGEYDFGDREATSSSTEPTPIGSSSPARAPSTQPQASRNLLSPPNPPNPSPSPSQGLGLTNSLVIPATGSPPVVPATWQGLGFPHTRSSTPSSVSSPLALAAPIVAAAMESSPPPLHHPVPQSAYQSSITAQFSASPLQLPDKLDATSAADTNTNTIRAKPITPALSVIEQASSFTPPISPIVSPKENLQSGHGGHSRRLSSMAPIISSHVASSSGSGPLSPRIPTLALLSRTTPSSIKDFDIIKPISKGAFGSVFLAKKKTTGDYYAIKVLKKADMIAKNQITNVKAERMIMMKQAESPFVVKLYWTFQSKDNLYLVMEYLNGGDCAALIKTLGCLPEEWTRGYVAEIVLGLEYLHATGVVHRDLKPDNLLIDQHGHLKLTDFGLSHIGLLGRQTQARGLGGVERVASIERGKKRYSPSSRHTSVDSTYFAGSPSLVETNMGISSSQYSSYFSRGANISTDNISEISASDSLAIAPKTPGGVLKPFESPLQSFATDLTNDLRSHSHSGSGTPPGEQKFVGTPDYLAPESILGTSEDDRAVDWWALGVITYEFLYGIPPFHDETPDKVFENIISRKIDWHEEWIDYTKEAGDYMNSLLTTDPKQRLGWNGAEEVKAHAWLAEIDWGTVTTNDAQFVPQISDPESTDYFDPRGAVPHIFQDDDPVAVTGRPGDSPVDQASSRHSNASPANDDFGAFTFKNLGVLKQANDDVIRKLKTDHAASMSTSLADPVQMHSRRRSVSVRKPQNLITASDAARNITSPPSPSTSTSSIASSPSRGSLPSSAAGSSSAGHNRRPSEFGPLERFKQHHMDDGTRRNSMPSRLRTSSMSSVDQEGHSPDQYRQQAGTPATSVASADMKKADDSYRSQPMDRGDQTVTCLIAEDNPISVKILETLLTRMGCRCVLVHDGAEAISVALGDIKFDIIFMDYHMPIMDGETAARYIKNTNNKNTDTPIVSVSAYSSTSHTETPGAGSVFAALLAKPVQKADIVNLMKQLGFKTTEGPKGKVAR